MVRAMSDRALRRSAWAVWWFLVVMIAASVPLSLVEHSRSAETWGSGAGAAGELAFVVLVFTFPMTGLLILRRQPRNTIGWLLQGIGLVWGLTGFADNYATYGLLVDPGSLPGPDVVAALNEGTWAAAIGLMGTFLILLYPDGRLPSRRWRPVAWLSAVTIVMVTVAVDLLPGRLEESPIPSMANPIAVESAQPVLDVILVVFLPLLPMCILASAFGLVVRFRRSRGVEREQLKWLATAGALVAFLFLVTLMSTLVTQTAMGGQEVPAWVGLLQAVSAPAFVLLPISIGIAILRHGLYEIDVIINRALVYGLLTAALVGVYLASVLLLQLALNPLTEQSDLAVAGSTLAVAALFRPARTRIQAAVDRRFYRSRYDAARTLDAFATRLRHELDLDAVGTNLRAAVHVTVQPAHVSLWLRP